VSETFGVDLSIQFFIDVDGATVAAMAKRIEKAYQCESQSDPQAT
jgi:hypothetical protein